MYRGDCCECDTQHCVAAGNGDVVQALDIAEHRQAVRSHGSHTGPHLGGFGILREDLQESLAAILDRTNAPRGDRVAQSRKLHRAGKAQSHIKRSYRDTSIRQVDRALRLHRNRFEIEAVALTSFDLELRTRQLSDLASP